MERSQSRETSWKGWYRDTPGLKRNDACDLEGLSSQKGKESSKSDGVVMGRTSNRVDTKGTLGEMTSAGCGGWWRDGSTSGVFAYFTFDLGAGQQEAVGPLEPGGVCDHHV